MAGLNDPDIIRNELRSACSPAVNELLFNFVGPGPLNGASEDELLAHIRSVAVKAVHPEVYRQQFFTLKQSDGETITHFVSRLKSQAMLCDFVRKCDNGHCQTSYSENMITSQLIASLHQSHQARILSEVNILKTLGQLTERLLMLESPAQAASHFQPVDSITNVAPIKSEYQRSKYTSEKRQIQRKKYPNTNVSSDKCKGCGRDRHQNGRNQCPAQGRKCKSCGKLNHFATVCMGTASNSITDDDLQQDDASFISTVCDTQPL